MFTLKLKLKRENCKVKMYLLLPSLGGVGGIMLSISSSLENKSPVAKHIRITMQITTGYQIFDFTK